jgi:hypothetical protein
VKRHRSGGDACDSRNCRNNASPDTAAAAPALLGRLAPLDALREGMERLAQYGMTKVGLADALNSVATHESLAPESYEPIIGALAMLLAASEAAGTIRPGGLFISLLRMTERAGVLRAQSGRFPEFL